MSNPLSALLPWRKITPLHKTLGPRSMRFYYPAGQGLPLTASPNILHIRYDVTTAIDRVIGFNFSIAAGGIASTFTMQELNTNWLFSYQFAGGGRGGYVLGNIETYSDEVNLQWSFSANPGSNVYIALYNFEVMPFSL